MIIQYNRGEMSMIEKKILSAIAGAYRDFQKGFGYGKTPSELFSEITRSLDASLGRYDIMYDFLCGRDTVKIDGVTKDCVLKDGDSVLIDVSVGLEGKWCDVCRTYFVGQPSERSVKAFEMIKESLREGERALLVGAKASDIYSAVNNVYKKQGKTLVHHAGHRIGETAVAQPQFLGDNVTLLESGNIYAIESGLYEELGIRLENDYYLTENGAIDLFEEILPLNIEEYILK